MILYAYIHGRRQRGQGGVPPWIFTHDTANVFFNKHSFCEDIPTLINYRNSLLQSFSHENGLKFSKKAGIFPKIGVFPKKGLHT